MESKTLKAKPAVKNNKKVIHWDRVIPLYIMALPGFIYLIINNYIPMTGLVVAFKKFSSKKGLYLSDWVGFKNFKYLFQTSDAWNITKNTILYNILFIVVGTILAIAFAILLNEIRNKFANRFFQTIVLVPYLMSWVVIAFLCYGFLSTDTGIFNAIFKSLGLQPVSWYIETKPWPYILLFVYMWRHIGYQSIVYLSSIVGISQDYYEASALDGATRWQQITRITLPMIMPTIIMMVLLSIGRIFYSDFGLFYRIPMNSGPIMDVTNTIDTYVYRALMQLGDIGMSSAAGFYQSIVGFICVLVSNLIVRKRAPESSLF